MDGFEGEYYLIGRISAFWVSRKHFCLTICVSAIIQCFDSCIHKGGWARNIIPACVLALHYLHNPRMFFAYRPFTSIPELVSSDVGRCDKSDNLVAHGQYHVDDVAALEPPIQLTESSLLT